MTIEASVPCFSSKFSLDLAEESHLSIAADDGHEILIAKIIVLVVHNGLISRFCQKFVRAFPLNPSLFFDLHLALLDLVFLPPIRTLIRLGIGWGHNLCTSG